MIGIETLFKTVYRKLVRLILDKHGAIYYAQILFLNINDMPWHNKLLIVVLQGINALPESRPFLKDFMMSLFFGQLGFFKTIITKRFQVWLLTSTESQLISSS
jgi:hypothetical protein